MLDMENDKAIMFSQPVKLEFTSSGHYCVNIGGNGGNLKDIQCNEQILAIAEDIPKKE